MAQIQIEKATKEDVVTLSSSVEFQLQEDSDLASVVQAVVFDRCQGQDELKLSAGGYSISLQVTVVSGLSDNSQETSK